MAPCCDNCAKKEKNDNGHSHSKTNYDDNCIREREALRIRLAQIQEEHAYNIQVIKNNIVNECELAIERELRECEVNYQNEIQLLVADITALQIELNSANKKLEVFESENQQLAADNHDLKKKIEELEKKLEKQRKQFEEKLQEELQNLEDRLTQKFEKEKDDLKKKFEFEQKMLENELSKAKDKLAEFENKYRQLLAELEKLRQALNEKNKDAEGWKNKYYESEKQKLMSQKPREEPVKDNKQVEKKLEVEIKELQDKLQNKKDQIKHLKENPIIKTQTVIVEKPVEVQVEKIVEVIKYQPIETICRERVGQLQPVIIEKHQHVEEIDDESIEKMTTYIRELEDLLRSRDETIDELENDNHRKTSEIDKLKRTVNDLNNKLREVERSTQDQMRKLEAKISGLRNDPINIKVDKDGNVHRR